MDIERTKRLNTLREKYKSKLNTNPLNEFSIYELKELFSGKTIINRRASK